MIAQAVRGLGVAAAGGIGVALTSGSAHDAITYGLALLTGVLVGLGLAARSGVRP